MAILTIPALLAQISAQITTNGNNEITGAILEQNMIDTVESVVAASGGSLSATLAIDNLSGNNHIRMSDTYQLQGENGGAYIDLNSTGSGRIKFNSSDGFDFDSLTAGSFNIDIGSFATTTHYTNWSQSKIGFGLFLIKSDFSRIGSFFMFENDTTPNDSGTITSYPVNMANQSGGIDSGVTNAVLAGGLSTRCKTSNGLTTQRVSLNGGAAFETRIEATTATVIDKIATLQDKTGIIAYLSDITAHDGNGIFSTANNGATIPAAMVVDINNTLSFTGGDISVGVSNWITVNSTSGTTAYGGVVFEEAAGFGGRIYQNGQNDRLTITAMSTGVDTGGIYIARGTGRVGIQRGALGFSPGATLHLKGEALVNTFLVQNSLGVSTLTVNDSGNVGIGKTPNSNRLAVEGGVELDNVWFHNTTNRAFFGFGGINDLRIYGVSLNKDVYTIDLNTGNHKIGIGDNDTAARLAIASTDINQTALSLTTTSSTIGSYQDIEFQHRTDISTIRDSSKIRNTIVSNTAGANEVSSNLGFFTDTPFGVVTEKMIIKGSGVINTPFMPTSPAGLVAGDQWNNSGVINII
jgi:hypothetical protein